MVLLGEIVKLVESYQRATVHSFCVFYRFGTGRGQGRKLSTAEGACGGHPGGTATRNGGQAADRKDPEQGLTPTGLLRRQCSKRSLLKISASCKIRLYFCTYPLAVLLYMYTMYAMYAMYAMCILP